jgi:hypothetical protein
MKRDEKYNTLIDWYMSYSEAMDFYDDIEDIDRKNVISYFSPYMIRSLARASLWSKNNYAGAAAEFKEALGINMRPHPKLNGLETFTAERGNLHVGVDQLSDISRVSTNYNWGKEDIESKVDGAIGFQWLYPNEVVTNAMYVKDSFQPLDTYLDQFADAARIPLAQFRQLVLEQSN